MTYFKRIDELITTFKKKHQESRDKLDNGVAGDDYNDYGEESEWCGYCDGFVDALEEVKNIILQDIEAEQVLLSGGKDETN